MGGVDARTAVPDPGLVEEGHTIPIARVQAMHEGKRRARRQLKTVDPELRGAEVRVERVNLPPLPPVWAVGVVTGR